jgi:WD40 repeat protein
LVLDHAVGLDYRWFPTGVPVAKLEFAPAGDYLAASGFSTGVIFWHVPTGLTSARVLNPDDGLVQGISFSADGSTLAVGTLGGSVTLWDVQTGTQVQSLRTPRGGSALNPSVAALVKLSPAGPIAAIANSTTIELLDLDPHRTIHRLDGHESLITDLSFAPSGKFLASASYDRTIKIWEVSSGTLVLELAGHGDAVWDIEFSHDGNLLASAGGDDRTARVWTVGATLRRIAS